MSLFRRLYSPLGYRKSVDTEQKPSRISSSSEGNNDHEFDINTEHVLSISDFTRVWRSCETLHGELCNPQAVSPPENFRVVDIHRQCVVPLDAPKRYVALSYVWGAPAVQASQPLRLTTENCAALEREFALGDEALPHTILDAISFCKNIGERYLWIDRLCILQNDASSKHQQIQQMASIFQNATLTIIAASGKDTSSGLPGIRPRQENISNHNAFQVDVGKSVWNERAWTFQEYLLSRKCVFFTPTYVYFQCRRGFWFEASHIPYPMDHKIKHLLFNNQAPLDNFGKAVTEYNTRKITYPSDILDAFSGVGTVLASALDTSLLLGLPESRLLWGLLWLPVGSCTKRIGVDYPSWTWLSWNCHVAFFKENFGQSDIVIYHQDPAVGLRHVSQSNQISPLSASSQFSNAVITLAQKSPGCLIFTSTLLSHEGSSMYSMNGSSVPTIKDINGDGVGCFWVARLSEADGDSNIDSGTQNATALVALATKERPRIPGYLDKSLIYVMLINRCNGVASRIGVGWVYKYWWDEAETCEETMVLV